MLIITTGRLIRVCRKNIFGVLSASIPAIVQTVLKIFSAQKSESEDYCK